VDIMQTHSPIARASRLAEIGVSEILRVVAEAAKRRAEGRDIIILAAGEPDFPTPDHVKLAACRAIIENETRYTALDGTPALKRAIVGKFARENGLHYEAGEISCGAGAKQVIHNVFMATLDEGDEVIVPTPCWTSYFDMVRIAGGVPVRVPLTESRGFVLTPDQLEQAITPKTRWLMINSPSNPTGAVYSGAELAALGQVLARHPHVGVVSDEIYEHIAFARDLPPSIVSVCPELRARTVIVNGVAKAYSMTGWRLGYAAGPRELIAGMATVQSQSTSNPCSISQAAAIAALSGPPDVVAARREAFQSRRDLVLAAIGAIPGLTCFPPGGAFYAFVNCTELLGSGGARQAGITDDAAFCRYLLDKWDLALIPGYCFDAPGYVRLSFAASEAELISAMDRLAKGVAHLMQ
jgi:aspartate aminotransferase